MNKPLLSLCIPTYNRERCLKDCLDSIVSQFNNPDIFNQVEVVISDNNSNDNTEKLVQEYRKKWNNIKYFKSNKNLGFDRNVLNVVDRAQGEYCWLLGDDDGLFPDAIGYMLEKLKLREFKYCIVNCLGYDNNLRNPALRRPNFAIESNQYFNSLKEGVKAMDKKQLVGSFCGLSIQIFDRQIWQAWPDKQEYIGSNGMHLYVLLSAFKERGFAIIAKPLVKTRSANVRWDTFPGLETLTKRVRGTTKGLIWILEAYDIPYSKLALKIEQNKNLFIIWCVNFLKKFLFRSQGSRDLIKKILGKL